MGVSKIDIMSHTAFMTIVVLAVTLSVSFFIIPIFYLGDSTRIINVNGCTIDRIQGSEIPICKEKYKLLYPDNATEIPRQAFLFQAPYLTNESNHDYMQWHLKLFGRLSIHMRKKVADSVFEEWTVNLLALRKADNTSIRNYNYTSTIAMKWFNSSDSGKICHYQDYIYNYTIPLLDFIGLPSNDYFVIVHNPQLKNHGAEVYGMTMTFALDSSTFFEFMVIPKIIFFVVGVVLVIWSIIILHKIPDAPVLTCAAIWSSYILIFIYIPLELSQSLDLDLGLRIQMFAYLIKKLSPILYYGHFHLFIFFFIFRKCNLYILVSWFVSVIILGEFFNCKNLMELSIPFFNLELIGWPETIVAMLFIIVQSVRIIVYIISLNERIGRKDLFAKTRSSKHRPTNVKRYNRSLFVWIVLFVWEFFTTASIVDKWYRYQTEWSDEAYIKIFHHLTAHPGIFGIWIIVSLMMLYFYLPVAKYDLTCLPPSYDECKRSLVNGDFNEIDAESQEKN